MATYHFSNTPQPTIKGSTKKINSVNHFRYICRDGSYDNGRQDLVHKETGNLPEWAKSPKDFWKQAEENSRANGRSYREIRVALPEELSLEENKALVDKFLKEARIKDDHVYTCVIHDKVAAFDANHNNIHAHIMFNERKIEHDRPLSTAQEFFSRRNVTLGNRETGEGAGIVSGGYGVDRWFSQRETTIHLRKVWENLVNEALQEKGLDVRVSCETLEKQQAKLEAEGRMQEASFLNRPVAPRLMNGYKRPFTLKKIHEQIEYFKKALDEDTVPDIEKDNIIDLFAHDVALRQKARQIQYNQKMATQANIDIAKEEELKSIKDDPMIVTVKNLRDAFADSHNTLITKLERLTAQYEKVKGDVIPAKNLEVAALNILTDGKYQESIDRYKDVSNLYKDEMARGETLIHDKEKYNEHLEKIISIRKERTDVWTETQRYKDMYLTGDRKAIDDMIKKIEEYNESKNNEAKTIYRNIRQTTKLLNASSRAMEGLKVLPDDHIAYSEKLPSLVTMKSKLNGETPLNKLPKVSYNGRVYLLTDESNPRNPKGIRLYDETPNGQAQVYQLTRSEKNGKMRTTSVTPLDEKAKMYKEHTYTKDVKTTSTVSKSSSSTPSPNKVIKNIASGLLNKELLKTPKLPKVTLPENNDASSILTEAEKRVEQMYKDWNAGFARMRLRKAQMMKVQMAKRREEKK